MKRIHVPAVLFCFFAGCYASASHGSDAGEDPSVDSFDVGEDSCIRFEEPAFESLEYSDTVSAGTPFTLTMHHELTMGPTAFYSLDGSVIDVTLAGMECLCTPCPIETPSAAVTSLMVEGLEAGEYTIDIQGNIFPLHVTAAGCERYPLGISVEVTCPGEVRVNQPVEIEFWGTGHSCDCNGHVETMSAETPPQTSLWGELAITAEEVICDPSSCCDTCRCIDTYDVKAPVTYTQQGLYQNYANGQWLCITAVFSEDGCSHWPARNVSVTAHTSWAALPPDGSGATANFTLSLSTGMCCSPAPIVITAREERDPDDPFSITIHDPAIGVCEGDCCLDCECVDSFYGEISVRNLTLPGVYTICIDGASCYTVEVT